VQSEIGVKAMIAIGRLCVGLALAVGSVGTVHAQPAPQSDSDFHITAWAPKPAELPPYVGVNRPHWKLAELLEAHRNDKDWSQTLVEDRTRVVNRIQKILEDANLKLASVVGAEFSVGALHALGGDDLALPTLLERLRRKELVEPTGTYWGDEPLHRFHHVLIRDAAYRRLLKGARADLHRRVGEWTDSTARNVVGENAVLPGQFAAHQPPGLIVLHPPTEIRPTLPEYDEVASGCVLLTSA